MRAGVVEQRDLVVVAAERVLRAIGDEQRQLLALALLLARSRSTSWLSAAKPTQNGAFGTRGDGGEDVDGRLQRRASAARRDFLSFARDAATGV